MSQENNFIPNQENYKPLTPFQLFVKSNFPFIEATFEALDNYGLYCKIIEYLNTVIENENHVEDNIESLYNAFVSLNNYVSNYFDNLDVQEEINNKLDEMALNGTLRNIVGGYVDYQIMPIIKNQNERIENFEDNVNSELDNINSRVLSINTGAPAGVYETVAALTSDNPDHSKIYVVIADGKWYYYSSGTNSWVAGGIYQSSGIADSSITKDMLNVELKNQYNANEYLIQVDKKDKYFNSDDYGYGIYGNLTDPTNRLSTRTRSFFTLGNIKKLWVKYDDPTNINYQIGLYCTNAKSYLPIDEVLIHDSGWLSDEQVIDFTSETYVGTIYFGIRIRNADNTSNVDYSDLNNLDFSIFVESYYDTKKVDLRNLSNILNLENETVNQNLELLNERTFTNTTTKNFKSPILNIDHPVLVAHRGYSGIAPENTLPAYEEAGKAGFWGCEGDVRETLDGEFVMFHDDNTYRMTGYNLNIAESTFAQLEALTITSGSNIELYSNLKIPKLEDYLCICKKFGMVPFIDSLTFNSDESYQTFIKLLDKYDLTDKCVLSSYNGLAKLRKIRAITDKPVCILNLTATDWVPSQAYFVGVMNELKNAGIGIDYPVFTEEQVEILRSCNSIASTYTVESVDVAMEQIAKGADIIITNSLTSLFKEYKS